MTTGTGRDNDRWVLPDGTAAQGDFRLVIDSGIEGWQHTMLRVAYLAEGAQLTHDSGEEESVIVPLSGSVRVQVTDADGGAHDITLAGRADVFAGPTDIAYAGRGATITLTATSGAARIALAGAPAYKHDRPKPFRHIGVDEVPVEIRGAGIATRQVRGFGLPDVLDADSILVCEVITPAGNWSSWPPHKHDEESEGESELEEIYYFETRSTDPRGTDPVGYQRVYGSGRATPIAPSMFLPRFARAMSSSCRTAGMVPRWLRRRRISITSTSWPAPARSAPGASATTPRTPGFANPGPSSNPTHAST